MKKNKLLKFIIFSVILLVTFNTFSFATQIIPGDIGPEMPTDTPSEIANNLIGSLKWIGYVIAIGMLVYVGIRYVISSADERASMKGLLVKVVIGSFIIIFANTIVNIVLSLAKTN